MNNIKWNFDKYFASLPIPETWESVERFADWYMENKMPIRIPKDSHVFNDDTITAIVLFRHNNFQVEMYIAYPNTKIDDHYHPDMEIITMQIGAMAPVVIGGYSQTLKPGNSHNGNFFSDRGMVFLTFEHWLNNVKPTSASIQWQGPTSGPKHDNLIKQHCPEAYVKDGFADVTIKV